MLRQRESKWLDMLNNWDKWMAKKHKKVRGLIVGLGLGVGCLGRKRKTEELHQLGGARASPAASCLRCGPSTRSEMRIEAVGRAGPSLHLILPYNFRLVQTLS